MKKHYLFKMLFLFLVVFFVPCKITEVNAADYSGISYGIVNFKTKSCGTNTSYTEYSTGRSGYTNGCYGADGAFLGMVNGKVKFMLSGVIGTVNASEVTVIDIPIYDASTYISSYRVVNGNLQHCVSLDTSYSSFSCYSIGKNTIGLKTGIYYLSYDGHYFYEYTVANFKKMIDDYKRGVRTNAYNKTPYYNYYQFVTHRTKTNQVATDFNNHVKIMTSNANSKMYNLGSAFITNQNLYGANGALVYGVAGNESAWGTSGYAINRNNLFGHSAYDSNPNSADYYSSPAVSVAMHAEKFISEGYLDPCDWSDTLGNGYNSSICLRGRYNGGHLGNKASGINVRYASDPYWGEKAASNYYSLENSVGVSDYGYYTLGIKTNYNIYNIRKEANPNSTILYQTIPSNDYPFIILGKVIGSDGKLWYKIQSDPTLDSTRSKLIQDQGEYNFANNYGYVTADAVGVYIAGTKAIENNVNINYNITFKANGGIFSDKSATKVVSTKANNKPTVETPTRAGYTFTGWNPTIVAATKATIYTAQWKVNQYNITFDANGGNFSDKTVTKTIKTNYNELPAIENPTREGYMFIGWNPNISKVTKEATYKAVWEKAITYNITFDADGGIFSDNQTQKTLEVVEGKTPEISAPFRSGYLFEKWEPALTTATKDTSYKAIWKEGTIEEELMKKDGEFYLEYLKEIDGKLRIKGYHIIKGINNDLNTSINYELVLKNQNTGKEYSQRIGRLLDEREMTLPIISTDGKNYKYSWFEGTVQLNNIEKGDYTAYFRTSTDKYYTKSYVQNILLNEQTTQFNTNSKYVTITNNYMDKSIPIEFIIRDTNLGEKETSYDVNQYSLFEKLSFENSKLHIIAASYSVGLDMRLSNTMLARELIFENIDTFEQKRFNVGSITTPIYPISLVRADKFGKTKDRAWFDKVIDISDLEKGTYAIYISAKSNISDYGELNDLLFQNLDNSKAVINGKTYVFKRNDEKRNRIELTVK